MKKTKQNINLRISLLLLPMLTACSAVKFAEQATETSTLSERACTERTVASITRMTKLIFLVDTSGSNAIRTRNAGTAECLPADADYNSCSMPTDPTKSFRAGSIQNFLNSYSSKTNFKWGFITFKDNYATALINNMGNTASPWLSPNPAHMQTAINQFYGITDYYATPYKAALDMAKQAILNDVDLHSAADPQYIIVMLTDGFPTDYNALNGSLDMNAIEADITALKAVAPGRISLSSIYYGVNNTQAISLLSWMTSLGNGQFANVNQTGSGIRIDDVIPGQTVCD